MTTRWDFIAARAAERKRIKDRMAELEKKIAQATARHEYYTTLELDEQLQLEFKELERIDGRNSSKRRED